MKGSTAPVLLQNGAGSFADETLNFDATLFTASTREVSSGPPRVILLFRPLTCLSQVPEANEYEPKPLELQVVTADGRVVAAARVNLSEYAGAREFVHLRSQLRSSTPGAAPVVVKFRLRCSVLKVTPVRLLDGHTPKSGWANPDSRSNSPSGTPMSGSTGSRLDDGLGALSRRMTATPPTPTPLQDKNDDLRLDNERLKAALEAQSVEMLQLADEHEEARADVARLKGALEAQSSEFQAQLDGLQSKLGESSRKAIESEKLVEARVAKLKRQIEEHKAELLEAGLREEQLSREFSKMESKVREANAEARAAVSQTEMMAAAGRGDRQLAPQVEEAKKREQELVAQLQEAKSEATKWEALVTSTRAEREAREAELEAQVAITAKSASVREKEVTGQLEKAVKSASEATATAAQLGREAAEREVQLQAAKDEATATAAKLAELEKKSAEREVQLAKALDESKSLAAELDAAAKEAAKKEAQLTRRLEETRQETAAQVKLASQSGSEREAELSAKLEKTQREVADLQATVAEMAVKLSRSEHLLLASQERESELIASVETRSKQAAEREKGLAQQLKESSLRVSALTAELADKSKAVETRSLEVENVRSMAKSEEMAALEAKRQLQDAEAREKALREKLLLAEKAKAAFEEQLASASERNAELKAQIAAAASKEADVAARYEQVDNKCKQVLAQLDSETKAARDRERELAAQVETAQSKERTLAARLEEASKAALTADAQVVVVESAKKAERAALAQAEESQRRDRASEAALQEAKKAESAAERSEKAAVAQMEKMKKSLQEAAMSLNEANRKSSAVLEEANRKKAALEAELTAAREEAAKTKQTAGEREAALAAQLEQATRTAAGLREAQEKDRGAESSVLAELSELRRKEASLAADLVALKTEKEKEEARAEKLLDDVRVEAARSKEALEEVKQALAAAERDSKSRHAALEEQLSATAKKQQAAQSENQSLKSRIGELSVALDLAKEQRADEKERAQELEVRVEELAAQMETDHTEMRKKLEAAEKQAKSAAALEEALKTSQKRCEALEIKSRELDQAKVAAESSERLVAQLKARVETLEAASQEREKQVSAADSRAKDAAADFGRLLARIGELEGQLATREEKTSEQLALMKRDLDKQADGKTERVVRELMERNVYLCKNREEFDKSGIPAAAKQLFSELKPHIDASDMDVLSGLTRAAGDFCVAEGQSLNVLFHVAAVMMGLARLAKGTPLAKLCVTAVAGAILPAGVGSVLSLWEKQTNKARGKTSAVPIAGGAVTPVWKTCIDAMVANRLPAAVIVSVSGALTAHLNRFIFNQIVKNSAYCTFGSGFQLKMELSNLVDFMYSSAQAPYLKQHNPLLAHVTEASSLLTISKDILTDQAILDSAFPHLNPRQIRTIIGQYQSEPGSSDIISPQVLQYFDRTFVLTNYPLELSPETANKFLAQVEPELYKL